MKVLFKKDNGNNIIANVPLSRKSEENKSFKTRFLYSTKSSQYLLLSVGFRKGELCADVKHDVH